MSLKAKVIGADLSAVVVAKKKYKLSDQDIDTMIDVAYENGKTLDRVAYEAHQVALALQDEIPKQFSNPLYREYFDSIELDLYDRVLSNRIHEDLL